MSHRSNTSKLDSLKSQRVSAGLTVGDLAKKANVNVGTIMDLENGDSIETHIAQRVCDALSVSLATAGHRLL